MDALVAQQNLQQALAHLETELAHARDTAAPVALDQSAQGRLSRMDAMQQQAMAQQRVSSLGVQLRRVHAALERCHSGSFGACCECGAPIEEERIASDLTVLFCQECADRRAEN